MKHRYLLIEASTLVDETSRFYFLNLGSTRQDNRDFLYVTALSMSKGYYFELYNEDARSFLTKVAQSLHPSSKTPLHDLSIVSASFRDYVRAHKANVVLNESPNVRESRLKMKSYLDANYRLANRSLTKI